MTVGITAEGLGDAISAAAEQVRSLGRWRRDKQWLKKTAEQIDEMLRNPAHPFRTTKTIARVLDDQSENYLETREILKGLDGVRHNAGSADTWYKRDNWQLDEVGKVLREHGRGILARGVKPGTF